MNSILTSIRRTPYQSLAAFLVLFFTLFLSMVLFVSISFLQGLLQYVDTRPQVTAYFQVKTPESEIFKVRDELTASKKVLSLEYVSKQKAYEIYKSLNKDNPLLLEMVSSDILPPSLEIYALKPEFLPQIAEYLKKQPSVEEVNFQKDIIERLLTLTQILRTTSTVFFAYLLIMGIVVLTATTMFKIALKRDEIELMRLLGATAWYIRKPFLMEGAFLGLMAAVFSFSLLFGILMYLNTFLVNYLHGIPNLSLSVMSLSLVVWPLNPLFMGITFAIAAIFGIGIAAVANLLATEKYLK